LRVTIKKKSLKIGRSGAASKLIAPVDSGKAQLGQSGTLLSRRFDERMKGDGRGFKSRRGQN